MKPASPPPGDAGGPMRANGVRSGCRIASTASLSLRTPSHSATSRNACPLSFKTSSARTSMVRPSGCRAQNAAILVW